MRTHFSLFIALCLLVALPTHSKTHLTSTRLCASRASRTPSLQVAHAQSEVAMLAPMRVRAALLPK